MKTHTESTAIYLDVYCLVKVGGAMQQLHVRLKRDLQEGVSTLDKGDERWNSLSSRSRHGDSVKCDDSEDKTTRKRSLYMKTQKQFTSSHLRENSYRAWIIRSTERSTEPKRMFATFKTQRHSLSNYKSSNLSLNLFSQGRQRFKKFRGERHGPHVVHRTKTRILFNTTFSRKK